MTDQNTEETAWHSHVTLPNGLALQPPQRYKRMRVTPAPGLALLALSRCCSPVFPIPGAICEQGFPLGGGTEGDTAPTSSRQKGSFIQPDLLHCLALGEGGAVQVSGRHSRRNKGVLPSSEDGRSLAPLSCFKGPSTPQCIPQSQRPACSRHSHLLNGGVFVEGCG